MPLQPEIPVYLLVRGMIYAGITRRGRKVKLASNILIKEYGFRETIGNTDCFIIHRCTGNQNIFEIRTADYQLRKIAFYETSGTVLQRLVVSYSAKSGYQKIIKIRQFKQKDEKFYSNYQLKIDDTGNISEIHEYRSKNTRVKMLNSHSFSVVSLFLWPEPAPLRIHRGTKSDYPEYAYMYATYIKMEVEGLI